MGKQTEIEWCDATWNPWYGCRKVSAGCKFCYAEREMTRYGRDFGAVTRAKDATFRAPLKWKEPRRIFTCSWSDFFIQEADPWRGEAWEIIRQTPQHTYMILTKRPEQIGENWALLPWKTGTPWPNVWIGVSAENDDQGFKRVRLLSQIRAAVQFLSYEPALDYLNLRDTFTNLDWMIVGGESARPWTKARPFDLDWAYTALAQCHVLRIPCFIKQLGSNPFYYGKPLHLRDWKGKDMSEWPEGLRVREWPKAIVNSEL